MSPATRESIPEQGKERRESSSATHPALASRGRSRQRSGRSEGDQGAVVQVRGVVAPARSHDPPATERPLTDALSCPARPAQRAPCGPMIAPARRGDPPSTGRQRSPRTPGRAPARQRDDAPSMGIIFTASSFAIDGERPFNAEEDPRCSRPLSATARSALRRPRKAYDHSMLVAASVARDLLPQRLDPIQACLR